MNELEMQCKIYLISLKRATERRERLINDLQRLDLDFELFDAVDGSELKEEQIKEFCNIPVLERKKSWFSKGMIGAALSHYTIYKKIIAENLPYAFIVEDDAKLTKDVKRLITEALQRIKENEVILFYYQSIETSCKISKPGRQKLDERYSLYYPLINEHFVGAGAYLITQKACRELVEIIFPVHVAPDDWKFFLKNGLSSVRLVYPKPVDTYDFPSNISSFSNLTGKSYFQILLDSIQERKIFPFYQLLSFRRGFIKRKLNNNFSFVNKRSVFDH